MMAPSLRTSRRKGWAGGSLHGGIVYGMVTPTERWDLIEEEEEELGLGLET